MDLVARAASASKDGIISFCLAISHIILYPSRNEVKVNQALRGKSQAQACESAWLRKQLPTNRRPVNGIFIPINGIFITMRNLSAFTAIVALANLAVTIWHLRLASELNPALSFPEAARIATGTGVLTLVGVSLLWARHRLAGSLVLGVVFAIGLVIGSLEHFVIPGPNNVFDAGVDSVAFLFRFNVALLVILEIAGLWGTARLIRSAWRSAAWVGRP